MIVGPHGGDVAAVSREIGIPAEEILDFSANVNPAGLPKSAIAQLERDVRDSRLLAQYPDPEAAHLRCALARWLAIPAESIVVGPGADTLIHAAIRTFHPQCCWIPTPAFSEYERACSAIGCGIGRIPLLPESSFTLSSNAFDGVRPGHLAILNHPHNPTGACMQRPEMLDLVRSIRSRGAAVLADEAFIDYVPGGGLTREAASTDSLVVIRSLTKFFGCAGLRVGYAVAIPEVGERIAAQLPSWPVTTLAANALAAALEDSSYVQTTLRANREARSVLAAELARLGCTVCPPAANFIFFRLPEGFSGSEIRERLVRESSILVRSCDSYAGLEQGRYLRVAVRSEADNARLVDALRSVLKGEQCPQHSGVR